MAADTKKKKEAKYDAIEVGFFPPTANYVPGVHMGHMFREQHCISLKTNAPLLTQTHTHTHK